MLPIPVGFGFTPCAMFGGERNELKKELCCLHAAIRSHTRGRACLVGKNFLSLVLPGSKGFFFFK